MRLEHLCDLDWNYQTQEIYGGRFVRFNPFGGKDEVGMGDLVGTLTGERLTGAIRGINTPVVLGDGVVLPDFRGLIRTHDDVPILCTLQGRTLFDDPRGDVILRVTFAAEDERYRWLNRAFCIFEGGVNPRPGGRMYICVNEYAATLDTGPAEQLHRATTPTGSVVPVWPAHEEQT